MKSRNSAGPKWIKIVLLIAFTLASTALPCSGHPADVFKISILHMNDPHGHYTPYKERNGTRMIGGFGKAATLIRKITAENVAQDRATLLLLAGDLLTGTPLSMVWKGELGVKLMNKMGFDAMVVGNHEFDHGQEHLTGFLKPMTQFPLLSANITDEAGRLLFQKSMEKDLGIGGAKVVILGLTTEATAQTTRPQNVKGLWFLNAVKTAKELLKGLSERDLVIALTHLGVKKDIKLAKSCPRINVIVGGHSHTALFEPLKVNDTIIVQAGAYAEYLGRLDLEVTDGKVVWYKGALIPLSPDIEEDKQIASVIDEYKSKMAARFEEVIGRTELFLDGSRHGVRSGKNTNLGSLITYTAARALGVQAALINGGTIRASINAGDITLDAIYTVLPFSDYLVGMDLTGEDILAALQRSSDLNEGSGGKLQTYGILFRNEGGKVVIEKVGGIPFSPKKYYSIATNDFLAEGGDGYNMLKEKGTNSYRSPILLSSAFVDLIKERKVITPEIINSVR